MGKIRLGIRKQTPGGERCRFHVRSVPPNVAVSPVHSLRQAEVARPGGFSANLANTVLATRR